ncbi:MAG: L,D-transpeptidase [Hyphomicrobiaceae bacterium]
MRRERLAGQLGRTAALAFAVLVLPMTTQAQAQFWFGGGGANTESDRQSVSFPKTYRPGEIIVSFGDRRLYYVTGPGQAISYPIAIPRPESRWQGVLNVSMKREHPTWTPTPRMRRENPSLPVTVPGGSPQNPLGSRAIYLGSTLYRIHGTDAPWTIGRNVSQGCIRMHNSHVEDLYNRVRIGARVTATWRKYNGQTSATAVASSSSSSSPSNDDWTRSIHRF